MKKVIAWEGEILDKNKLSEDLIIKTISIEKLDTEEGFNKNLKKSVTASKKALTSFKNHPDSHRYNKEIEMHENSLQQNQQVLNYLYMDKKENIGSENLQLLRSELDVNPLYQGSRKAAQEFINEEAGKRQLAFVIGILKGENPDSIIPFNEDMREVRFYEFISSSLRMYENGQDLSSYYNNKPFGEFQSEVIKRIKETFVLKEKSSQEILPVDPLISNGGSFYDYLLSNGINIEKDSHFFGETTTIIDLDTKKKFRVVCVEEDNVCLKPLPSFSEQKEEDSFCVTYLEIFEKFRSGSIQVDGFEHNEEREFARVLLNVQKHHRIENLMKENEKLSRPFIPLNEPEPEPSPVIIEVVESSNKEEIEALTLLLKLEEDPKEKKVLRKKIKELKSTK